MIEDIFIKTQKTSYLTNNLVENYFGVLIYIYIFWCVCVCVCFGYFLLAAEMEKNTDNDVTRPWSEERNAMESSVSAKLYANISSRPVSI